MRQRLFNGVAEIKWFCIGPNSLHGYDPTRGTLNAPDETSAKTLANIKKLEVTAHTTCNHGQDGHSRALVDQRI